MRLFGLTDLSNSLVHNGLRHSQYVKVRRLFIYQILWKKLLSSALKKILYSKNNLVFTKLCNFLNFYSHLALHFVVLLVEHVIRTRFYLIRLNRVK